MSPVARYIITVVVLAFQNLELFDELEEWHLIQQHYFVSVAVKGSRLERVSQTESIITIIIIDLVVYFH